MKNFLTVIFLTGLGLAAPQTDTKTYEKDMKLVAEITSLGALSDRGIQVCIANRGKTDHYISFLIDPKGGNCPLYVSFTGFMDDGNGKYEKLFTKYREPSAKDFNKTTKALLVPAGKTVKLFSMLFSPKQLFATSRVGSVKVLAHYHYLQRGADVTTDAVEQKIPAFSLTSDTVIVQALK